MCKLVQLQHLEQPTMRVRELKACVHADGLQNHFQEVKLLQLVPTTGISSDGRVPAPIEAGGR